MWLVLPIPPGDERLPNLEVIVPDTGFTVNFTPFAFDTFDTLTTFDAAAAFACACAFALAFAIFISSAFFAAFNSVLIVAFAFFEVVAEISL